MCGIDPYSMYLTYLVQRSKKIFLAPDKKKYLCNNPFIKCTTKFDFMIGGILQHLMLTNAQAEISFLSILYSIL